jgi:bacterioferritin-associated ferredoxin
LAAASKAGTLALVDKQTETAAAMIICSCNVISDREVRAAVKCCGAKASRVREVFQHCGRAPKCGKCIRSIQQELEAASEGGLPANDARELVCA